MSFLDNLENSLKTLETSDERDPQVSARREQDRRHSLAAAPWADRLKTSPYTQKLLEHTVGAGHRIRAKIYMAWVGTTLRLEVRGRFLELQPGKDGITAKYLTRAGEEIQMPLDLETDPEGLLAKWLEGEKPPPPRVIPEDWDSEEAATDLNGKDT